MSPLLDSEFSESVPIQSDIGDYAFILESACRTSPDTLSHQLRVMPKWVFAQTVRLLDLILKIGLFTRGRRREVIVLAAMKVVFGSSLPLEDLLIRAKERFGLTLTPAQIQNTANDIMMLRRQYRNCRFRRVKLSREDKRLLTRIRRQQFLNV